MRLYAFTAVAISTASVIASIVILPMLFTSIHDLRSEVFTETDFCKVRVRDIWYEMYALGRTGPTATIRQKRGWLFGQFVPEGGRDTGAPAPAVS